MKIAARIKHQSHIPITLQIAECIRRLIKTGRLPAGALLPSVRRAADDWGVNFTTVSRAYKLLRSEGLIVLNTSRRLEVAAEVRPTSKRTRLALLTPMILGLKAQARELGLNEDELRDAVQRTLKWKPEQ